MSITQLNLDWNTYFCILALITLWILGLTAATQKTKIGYPLRAFLDKTKNKVVPIENITNGKYNHLLLLWFYNRLVNTSNDIEELTDDEIRYRLQIGTYDAEKVTGSQVEKELKAFLNFYTIASKETAENSLLCVITNTSIAFHADIQVRVFPWQITDPLLTCVTCMASFHSLVIYTAIVILHNANRPAWVDGVAFQSTPFTSIEDAVDFVENVTSGYPYWHWNPLELIAIAVPVAFLGEFFWSLRMKLK